jgi:hypothetical protein
MRCGEAGQARGCAARAPVIDKYTGVLAAADIEEFTTSTTFMILQSLRLDRGIGLQVHP